MGVVILEAGCLVMSLVEVYPLLIPKTVYGGFPQHIGIKSQSRVLEAAAKKTQTIVQLWRRGQYTLDDFTAHQLMVI